MSSVDVTCILVFIYKLRQSIGISVIELYEYVDYHYVAPSLPYVSVKIAHRKLRKCVIFHSRLRDRTRKAWSSYSRITWFDAFHSLGRVKERKLHSLLSGILPNAVKTGIFDERSRGHVGAYLILRVTVRLTMDEPAPPSSTVPFHLALH